jgi:hypothetical protein
MAYQTGRNIVVNYKAETTFGTLAGATGSTGFRANRGAVNLTKAAIRSGENRRDGMMTRGRHGSRSVGGNYTGDLSLGTFDALFEAVFRSTIDSPIALTGLSLTADNAAKTITRGSGSWITDGIRVGDVIRGTLWTTTANNNKNWRVVGVTATVLTLAEAPTTVSVAETGVAITRPKKLLQGTTRRSFTWEENELDIDASEVFTGCRIGGMTLNLTPDGMITVQFTMVGQDMQVMSGAGAPYFTNPTLTTSLGMTSVEAVIRYGTTDVLDLTALELSINLNAAAQPVVGSLITPDVFDNLATMEGRITALRQDMTRVQDFLSENQVAIHLMFTENEAAPADFCSFFLGNVTLSGATKSELGNDGARTQDSTLMIGKDERGGAYNPSMISFQTSSP